MFIATLGTKPKVEETQEVDERKNKIVISI
jgi:hypothetical protein